MRGTLFTDEQKVLMLRKGKPGYQDVVWCIIICMGEDAKISSAELAELQAYRERHERNRESLLSNEGFAISMQQVVAGALLLAPFSSLSAFAAEFGVFWTATMVSVAGLALIFAVLAAQLRHDYRMWDVKATASASLGRSEEASIRAARTHSRLVLMRIFVRASTGFIVLGIALILMGVWTNVVLTPLVY